MRKVLTVGLAALTLGGALAAAAAPADAAAYGWRGGAWRGGGWRGGGPGLAVAAGILGLAAGAAIADSQPHYYGPAYYPGGPYGYAACVGHRRVWDPYYGGYVVRSFRYAC
jgi:hypothetical protein